MRFPDPLVPGRLIARYKRFLADVALAGGGEVTAHVANPGAMTGLAAAGAEVWLSPARGAARKLRWSWELTRAGGGLVGVNTHLPNAIAAEAIGAGRAPALAGYARMRREVRYGAGSRIDLLLEDDARGDCHVEIKNVNMRRGRAAVFPDAPTKRGARHLGELARLAAAGRRAAILYVVQREDCDEFRVADDIDPAYDAAFAAARAAGVEAYCHACRVDTGGIALDRPLPIAAGPGRDGERHAR